MFISVTVGLVLFDVGQTRGKCGKTFGTEAFAQSSELRSCVKVEMDVPDSPSLVVPNDVCGRKVALNGSCLHSLQRRATKAEVQKRLPMFVTVSI